MMNIVNWNVRGLGGSGKVVAINKMVGETKPFFLGLVEPKHSQLSEHKLAKWWNSRHYDWAYVKTEEGSGGLICIWNKGVLFDGTACNALRGCLVHLVTVAHQMVMICEVYRYTNYL